MATIKISTWLRERYDLVALWLAMALLMFFWTLGANKELWFDERFVQVMSGQPFSEMIKLLRLENNPPFVFLLVHFWQHLFGTSETALRTASLLPSLGFLVVLRLFAYELSGKAVTALAVVLAAVATQVTLQAVQLRMYAWELLWATLALQLAWRFYEQRRMKHLVWLTTVNIIGLYTHYTYLFVLVGVGGWLWWMMAKHRLRMGLSYLLTGVAFLPWFIYSLGQKVTDLNSSIGYQGVNFNPLAAFSFWGRLWYEPALFESTWLTIMRNTSLAMMAVVWVWVVVWTVRKKVRSGRLGLLGWYAAVGTLLLTFFDLPLPKYAIVLVPVLAVAVAYGIRYVIPNRLLQVLVAAWLIMSGVFSSYFFSARPYSSYIAASDVIERTAKPDDRVLIFPFSDRLAVEPYYQGSVPVEGFFPFKPPGQPTLEDVVRYNSKQTLTAGTVDQLAAYVGTADRVWFLYDKSPFSPADASKDQVHLMHAWFSDHQYTPTIYRDIFENVPPILIRYDRQ